MILITVLNLYLSFGKDAFNDDVRWIRFDWCFIDHQLGQVVTAPMAGWSFSSLWGWE